MGNIYKMVEPKEGEHVQYVGVYVLHWRSSWGEPEVAFVEDDEKSNELAQKEARIRELEEALKEIILITPIDALNIPPSDRMRILAREALSEKSDKEK